MKIRTSFVTNSSSSSFVCEICGRSESGWDISLEEADMMECVNGHVFCRHEALEWPSKQDMIKTILENEYNKDCWDGGTRSYRDYSEEELLDMDEETLFVQFISESYYSVPESMCPICQFIEYSDCDLSKYLFKTYSVSRDEVFAEVKKFNKRRKKLYDSEYITFVCKKFDLNPTEIVANWKTEFGTYSDFQKWLYN